MHAVRAHVKQQQRKIVASSY